MPKENEIIKTTKNGIFTINISIPENMLREKVTEESLLQLRSVLMDTVQLVDLARELITEEIGYQTNGVTH